MNKDDYKPKLRWPLELQPVEQDGSQWIVIRDRSGITEQPAVVPAPLMAIISRFDGINSAAVIAAELAKFGVTPEFVLKVAAELDGHLLLDNEKSQNRWLEIQRAYGGLEIRPAAFAGAVYSGEPKDLKRELDGYAAKAAPVPAEKLSRAKRMAAIASPHIDYRRGWHAYATAAAALSHCPAPEIIFLIGTSHQASRGIFHLTRKGFETPLGRLNPALEVIEDLAKVFGPERSFQEEILHRSEHSLELQVPFLQRRFCMSRPEHQPLVVPILVGSFHSYLESGLQPDENGEARDFIGAWTEVLRTLETSGRKTLIYAGIDLAHVGLHFGDSERVAGLRQELIDARDRELISAVLAADEKRLFAHIAEDLDARRICGFPTLYTMLSAVKKSGKNLQGDLIEYRQAADPQNDCVVTFASAYWSAI